MKLLLVEDDADDMAMLRRRLRGTFDFDSAMDMKEADAALQARIYDGIILDIGLPDYSRLKAVDHVKTMARGAAVIVLSGYHERGFAKEMILQNASSYLVKGCDDLNGEALAASINAAISSNRVGQKIDTA